jgi:hypothetical protein
MRQATKGMALVRALMDQVVDGLEARLLSMLPLAVPGVGQRARRGK